MVTNPSIENAGSDYNSVLYAVESFFIIILLISAIRLIFSSILGAVDRAAAKEGLKKVFINMFLVWVSFDVYSVAIQLSNAFSVFLAPSAQDWSSNLFPLFMNPLSFVILVIAVATVLIAALLAVIRWVMVYIGLFVFPIALALNAFPITEQFGRFFLSIIIVNFVVQIIGALFMRIILSLISSGPPSGIFVAAGSLVLMVLITFGLYLTTIFNAISENSWLRRSF